MAYPPAKCPECGEENGSKLSYCSVCGHRFVRKKGTGAGLDRRRLTRDQKLRMKKEKKKRELTELFKAKKITMEQYRKGLNKLGYVTDVDKAEELKRFIRSQIRDLQSMKMPQAGQGGYRHDPYESKSDLVRDEYGNVITDFMVSPSRADPKGQGSYVDHSSGVRYEGKGPLFGESLFEGRESGNDPGRKRTANATMTFRMGDAGVASTRPGSDLGVSGRRRIRDLTWDDDEEISLDAEVSEEEQEEDDFEIDLDEGGYEEQGGKDLDIDLDEKKGFSNQGATANGGTLRKGSGRDVVWWEEDDDEWWDEEREGESGWWDDDNWVLEWEEEDEEEWEIRETAALVEWEDDFEIDLDDV